VPNLTHIERIRQEMPATRSCVYLNTGTFGPLPTCAFQIMQQQMQDELQTGRLGMAFFDQMHATSQQARQAVARLLHAHEDEIALTGSTGDGLNIISYGFHWQQGDEVITTNHEHFNLLAPLYQLRERYGIVIRVADLGANAERPLLDAVAEQMTSRTRLVALSHVTWTNGVCLPIGELRSLCEDRGILVLVDGAQSAGAIPVDVHALGIDFYALPGQKWLCGPDGTGALYVRQDSSHLVTSTYVGYQSVEDPHGETWKLLENARRFEMGGRHSAAIAAQAAALNWLEETVGHRWMFERIAELHGYAFRTLQSVPGLHVLTPQPASSGLLAFTLEGKNADEVVTHLREQYNLYLRTIPERNSLRLSCGFYNTEKELDTLLKALIAYQSIS